MSTAPVTAKSAAKSASAAWTAAIIIIALCLIATFTLRTPAATNVASNGRGASASGAGGGSDSAGDQSGGDQGSGNQSAAGSAGSDIAGSSAGGGAGTAGGAGGKGGAAGATGTKGANGIINVAGADCANGKNAGWHGETGVSATQISFAATTVKSGIAKDFLADAQFGMEAVRTKVNRSGGVCGRQIAIDYKDDGWDSGVGGRYIQDFIGENKYFGLAVNPSSEGLKSAIDAKVISNAKFPVVGSDGMLHDQYADPWVWPVATSTASVMHIMAKEAVARGAKSYAIVWDGHYRFGQEGHDAFVGEFKRDCPGCQGPAGQGADQQVDGTQGDFASQANTLVQTCGGTSFSKCDFVAMLLEPAAADSWAEKDHGLGDGTTHPKVGVGVPQPLFVNSFVRNCGAFCSGMYAWTSFKPPISPFDGEAKVQTYVADLQSVSRSADSANPHVEGAYVGMLLLVDALNKLGAAPTRDGIRTVLDSTTLDTGLTPTPITFKPGNHYGSVSAQAFQDITQGNSFANWRYRPETGLTDPNPAQDVS